MNKIPNEIYRYISSIQNVEFHEKQIIIDTKKGIYAYIPVCSSNDLFSSLEENGFSSFYYPINSLSDSFQLFSLEGEKERDILPLLKEYYLKSLKKVSFDSQMVSMIYQKCSRQFHQTYQFFFDLQNRIEEMLYPRRVFYNLLLQMSDVYRLLYFGEFFLNAWREMNPTEYQEVFILREIGPYNFWGNKIVNVSNSKRDYYIFELANYYRMYFYKEEILEEIHDFFHSFPSAQADLYLFYALISSLETFDLEMFDSEEKYLFYVSKTLSFVSEKYKQYQENKEKMLKEK